MSDPTALRAAIAAIATLLILDGLWIALFMGRRYSTMIPTLQGGTPMRVRVWTAVVAYLLMCLGLLVFVLPQVRDAARDGKSTLRSALFYGGLFGIVVYGVYDATAATVLTDWSIPVALADVAWGGFVYATAAYVGSLP